MYFLSGYALSTTRPDPQTSHMSRKTTRRIHHTTKPQTSTVTSTKAKQTTTITTGTTSTKIVSTPITSIPTTHKAQTATGNNVPSINGKFLYISSISYANGKSFKHCSPYRYRVVLIVSISRKDMRLQWEGGPISRLGSISKNLFPLSLDIMIICIVSTQILTKNINSDKNIQRLKE